MDYFNPGPSQASFAALQAQLTSALPLGPYTVATLPTPDASNLYRIATVTDLFGSRSTRVRCEMVLLPNSTPFYYWQPSSSDAMGTIAAADGAVTLNPLTSPTSVSISGTLALGLTMNVTLGTLGGWPGAVKEVRNSMSSLLGAVNLLGTGLGSGVSLALGGYTRFVLDYTTNVPVWVRLQ